MLSASYHLSVSAARADALFASTPNLGRLAGDRLRIHALGAAPGDVTVVARRAEGWQGEVLEALFWGISAGPSNPRSGPRRSVRSAAR